jgi:uncharacterized protein YndB with AHSA1/START domain
MVAMTAKDYDPSDNASTKLDARKGRLIVEGERATIIFARTLHHNPELVWRAITDPGELKQWLLCSYAKIDGRTGGSIEMIAGPSQFQIKGRILIWDPPRVFEHEWKVDPVSNMPQGEDAIFRYELSPDGESTVLTVTYRQLTRRTATGFAPGTHVLLDRLEAQLDKRPLADWMTRFQAARSYYPVWNE